MKKPYMVAAALLVFVAFNSWNHYNVKQRGERDAAIFNSSTINGKITYLSASAGAVYFKVENSGVKYMFIPKAVSRKAEERFSAFATKGDSVSKTADDMVLKLFKGDKIYLYSFRDLHKKTASK